MNCNSGTETYAANLTFMWQTVTTWNNQDFSACFISMWMINSKGLLYHGGYKFQKTMMLSDKFNKMTDFWLNTFLVVTVFNFDWVNN